MTPVRTQTKAIALRMPTHYTATLVYPPLAGFRSA
jgi:hypothetical protein